MTRDLDLIAVPWVKAPKSPDVLAEKIADAVCKYGYIERTDTWHDKPNGRKARVLTVGMDHFIDLSVVPFIDSTNHGSSPKEEGR